MIYREKISLKFKTSMDYRTTEFIDLVKKNIKNGDIGMALELLTEGLTKKNGKSRFLDLAIQLKGRYKELSRKESLGITSGDESRNKIRKSIIDLLNEIKNSHPIKIDLKKIVINNQLTSLPPPQQHRKKKSQKNKIIKPDWEIATYWKIISFAVILVVAALGCFFNLDLGHRSPTDRQFAIELNQFKHLSKAIIEKNKYKTRDIEILKENLYFKDKFKTIIRGFNNKEEADKELKRLNKYSHWIDAKTINLGEYCTNVDLRIEKNIEILICN